MSHPYQCLLYCQQASQSETGILVGACGSSIRTFNAQNGQYLSSWPPFQSIAHARSVESSNTKESEEPLLKDPLEDEPERPTKRQRLSPAREESASSSTEIVVAGDSDNREVSTSQQPSIPPIIKLAGTSTGEHVIAVTGEDKCIRVFDLAADGTLTQLSERQETN